MSEPQKIRSAFETALHKLGPGSVTVVDVGARWGAAASWFRLKPLAKLFGFEPDPAECQRLNESGDSSQERVFPVALGKEDGMATLYNTREPGCSSLYPPSDAVRSRHPSLREIMAVEGTSPVKLTRLSTWAKEYAIPRVDFIKLDTQGSEFDILTGADSVLDHCLGIEAEVMFSPLYDGQPLFADVDRLLRSRGFTLWRLENLAHYSERPTQRLHGESDVFYEQTLVRHQRGDGRLVWANAVYFRDREQFVNSERDLLVLAALLEAAGDWDGSESCLLAADQLAATASQPISPCLANLTPQEVETYVRALPIGEHAQRRVLMTYGCRDSESIPKVPNAGRVFLENGQRIQLMHNGVKVVEDGYNGRWMTELIKLLSGHHEPQDERAFHEILAHLQPGAHMVELGAFWGYYSLWFAKAIPGGRIVAVEPDPSNLNIGLQNFALNGVPAEFHQYSVGAKSAPPELFPCESDNVKRMIPCICVDDLVELTKLPRIDLLLADIQGAELAMLHGATRCLEQGLIRFVLIGTHHHLISGDPLIHQKCVQFIQAHRGHILAEHNVTEGYSGDGLIVASFDPADTSLPHIHLSKNHPSNSFFRELEYDLGDAYTAIEEVGKHLKTLAEQDPRLGTVLTELRTKLGPLGNRWPV